MKKMSSALFEARDLGLVRRIRDDEEDDEIQKPLEWSLIRRMFVYVIRAAQLPALVWLATVIIKGPISHGDAAALWAGVFGYAVLALSTDGLFHFASVSPWRSARPS
jgi:hypothetical protein